MQAGVGFLSRFSFAVTELGGQLAICDRVSVSDSPEGSAETVGSSSEGFCGNPSLARVTLFCRWAKSESRV